MKDILFLDIETVSEFKTYKDMPDLWKKLWQKKASSYLPKEIDPEVFEMHMEQTYLDKAALHPEFSRILCISVGYIHENEVRTLSFSDGDEKVLLESFKALLDKQEKRFKRLCAHNGKTFDYPFICKRMILHKVPIPGILNQEGKKPWEILNLDTKEQWSFGVFNSQTSLELLCAYFDIPTPKDGIDGSMVHHVYYYQEGISTIVEYCEKDVKALAEVYKRINNL